MKQGVDAVLVNWLRSAVRGGVRLQMRLITRWLRASLVTGAGSGPRLESGEEGVARTGYRRSQPGISCGRECSGGFRLSQPLSLRKLRRINGSSQVRMGCELKNQVGGEVGATGKGPHGCSGKWNMGGTNLG